MDVPHASSSRGRRGVSSLYTVVMLTVLCGFVSFGVDLGRVQLAKTELRVAADAAARAAARALAAGDSQARAAAVAVAAANTCDGQPVALDPAADVETGTWNPATRTFTPGAASPNAVRVTARRIAARNSAIPLTFARVVGRDTCDVSASAIAACAPSSAGYGIVGIDSITMSGNASTDSYDSSAGPYSPLTARARGSVSSNGNITMSGNARVRGDARPGPGCSVRRSGNATVTGSTAPLSAALSYPPPSLPESYTWGGNLCISGNSTVTLPAGVYYYNNISVSGNATIRTTGQVTVYVAGSVSLSGNAVVHQNRPENFRIRVLGSGSVSVSGNGDLWADIYAPSSAVSFTGNGDFFGALVGRTLTISGNGDVHYDESLGGYGASAGRVSLVH